MASQGNKRSIDREIAYWNIITLNSLRTVVAANTRVETGKPLTPEDREYRDMYFSGKWRDGKLSTM